MQGGWKINRKKCGEKKKRRKAADSEKEGDRNGQENKMFKKMKQVLEEVD